MRSSFWDVWKGVSIVAVVAIHASSEAFKMPADSFGWTFGLVFRQFVNFAVPMFLALAGFFAASNRSSTASIYYADRLRRVIPPYLIWTTLFVAFKQRSHFASPADLFEDYFLGVGISIGYFVIVLVQYILITPLLIKIRSVYHHVFVMLVLAVTSLAMTYWLQYNHAEHPAAKYPLNVAFFFAWYPFYHLGLCAAKFKWHHHRGFQRCKPVFLSLFALFTALAVAEALQLAAGGRVTFAASQVKLTSFLASGALVFWALSLARQNEKRAEQKSWIGRALTWLGQNSYPIYLSHLFFFASTVSMLKRLPGLYEAQPLFILLDGFLLLATSVLMVLVVKRYAPPIVQKYALGIQPTRGEGQGALDIKRMGT